MPFGGLLTVGLLGAGSSIFGGIMGSKAADKASSQQTQSGQAALDFQKQIWEQQQKNMAPYSDLGTSSIGTLMQALQGGMALPNAPQFTGTFHTPTADEARATPGYEFTAQQGSKGILQGAAAAGGAISGGTLRALDTYNTGLADSTYNDVFNRSLSTYNTGLQAYQANLQGYQADLAKQGLQYQEAFAPVQLGENAVAGVNNQGSGVASNVGNLMTQIGNSQAAGTVGSANALSSGVSGGINDLLQSVLLSKIMKPPTTAGAGPG